MIDVRCETIDCLPLSDMSPFQGDLKSRTEEQLEELKKSLREEGLLAPFFIWRAALQQEDGVKNWLLDGHARYEALRSIYDETGDEDLWTKQAFPIVYIEAASPDEAKKALLQITSSYGKITRGGAQKFCASIPEYRAPSVAAFFKPVSLPKEKVVPMTETAAEPAKPVEGSNEVVITIAVPASYEVAVRALFNSVSYIRIL